jgi:galactonate dehydratase
LHEEVEAALEAICKRVSGREINGIERFIQEMLKGRFWRDGPVLNTAISALEMALWDLQGKQLGAPVYQLLGGPVRDKVTVYRNLWGENPEQFAASGKAAIDEGLKMMKVSPAGPTTSVPSDRDLQGIIDTVSAVREAIGDAKLAIDLHGRLTPAASRRLLPMLQPFDLSFVEEPCLPSGSAHHLRDLQELHLEQPVTLATGERLLTKREFADHLFPSPVVGVLQPDLSLVGGIRAGVEIGAMCEAAQVALAPHCPYGPIQLAASLQVAAASPAHAFQEFQSLGGAAGGGTAGGGAKWDFNLLATPFEVEDSMVAIPTKPGLGIEVQEHLIEEHMEAWNPHPPTLWHHPDGSHAEW